MSMEHPSGQQFDLSTSGSRAVVTEVGGGIRRLTVDGVEVLDGYGIDDKCDGARGQTLLPWPNRVADGRYTWEGVDHQLALTEPARHNAIHGLTRWANWELIELKTDRVHLRHRLHSQLGWPFTVRCDLRYALRHDGLEVTTVLTNLGTTPCPVAAGAHPYLSAGAGLIDSCRLALKGDTVLPTDRRGIPTGSRSVAGTPLDFRDSRVIGTEKIDLTYTDLHRDPSGAALVDLERPDGERLRLWAGEGYGYLEVFTGDTLAPDRRRRGLGVEPMTSPPNALQTGRDLLRLQPSESVELTWGVGRA
jgi:aldose 1-epimerase